MLQIYEGRNLCMRLLSKEKRIILLGLRTSLALWLFLTRLTKTSTSRQLTVVQSTYQSLLHETSKNHVLPANTQRFLPHSHHLDHQRIAECFSRNNVHAEIFSLKCQLALNKTFTMQILTKLWQD